MAPLLAFLTLGTQSAGSSADPAQWIRQLGAASVRWSLAPSAQIRQALGSKWPAVQLDAQGVTLKPASGSKAGHKLWVLPVVWEKPPKAASSQALHLVLQWSSHQPLRLPLAPPGASAAQLQGHAQALVVVLAQKQQRTEAVVLVEDQQGFPPHAKLEVRLQGPGRLWLLAP